MLKDRNKYIEHYKCDICGGYREPNYPILYGYNTRYACCFDCYELYGTALNRAIEKGKNHEG